MQILLKQSSVIFLIKIKLRLFLDAFPVSVNNSSSYNERMPVM